MWIPIMTTSKKTIIITASKDDKGVPFGIVAGVTDEKGDFDSAGVPMADVTQPAVRAVAEYLGPGAVRIMRTNDGKLLILTCTDQAIPIVQSDALIAMGLELPPEQFNNFALAIKEELEEYGTVLDDSVISSLASNFWAKAFECAKEAQATLVKEMDAQLAEAKAEIDA